MCSFYVQLFVFFFPTPSSCCVPFIDLRCTYVRCHTHTFGYLHVSRGKEKQVNESWMYIHTKSNGNNSSSTRNEELATDESLYRRCVCHRQNKYWTFIANYTRTQLRSVLSSFLRLPFAAITYCCLHIHILLATFPLLSHYLDRVLSVRCQKQIVSHSSRCVPSHSFWNSFFRPFFPVLCPFPNDFW